MQRQIIKKLDPNEKSFRSFRRACKSIATQKAYKLAIDLFMSHAGYTSYDGLAKTDASKIKSDFEDYFDYLHDRYDRNEIKWNYFRPPINAIELFLIQNDIEINFKKYKKQIPEQSKISGDQPYTTEEVQDMIKEADVRGKCLVLLLSSTGIRGGSIWDLGNYLKFKHLLRFNDGCARITIYPDTKSEHPAILTPEALEALDKYKRYRIANGEQVDGESPLFRNIFSKNQASRTIKPLKKSSIDAILRRLAENIGVRTRSNSPYKRHEKRTEYGFRIRWNTIMKNHEPPLNVNKIERLFSHNNKNLPLDKHYNKPLDHVLHEEFDKAILALTIDPTKQQEITIKNQKEKITNLDKKEDEIRWLLLKQQQTEEWIHEINEGLLSGKWELVAENKMEEVTPEREKRKMEFIKKLEKATGKKYKVAPKPIMISKEMLDDAEKLGEEE